jgi:hypothetical protein
MAERKIALSGSGSSFKIDAIEAGTSFEVWTGELPLELLEAAGTRDHVEIVESDSARATARVTRLSTVGLSQAIGLLRGRCGGMPDCPQVSSPQVSSWAAGNAAGAPQGGWAAGALMPKAGAASPAWGGDAASVNCAALQMR